MNIFIKRIEFFSLLPLNLMRIGNKNVFCGNIATWTVAKKECPVSIVAEFQRERDNVLTLRKKDHEMETYVSSLYPEGIDVPAVLSAQSLL